MTNVCSVVPDESGWSCGRRCAGCLGPLRDFRASGAPLCLWSKAQGA